ncbi:MAG: hypothetical protein HY874_10705 [Chloroflexi bacterium]|nr:hypothetical protein [Chloroflexota bacterium]
MKRIGMAVAIAAVIYGVALGAGSLLYATGAIATGATHNDCADFKREIARERGIDMADVPQGEVKARTEACLGSHELTAREAFRSEYLLWSAWPAAICAAIFLAWPVWVRILRNQELAEERDGPGSGTHEADMA